MTVVQVNVAARRGHGRHRLVVASAAVGTGQFALQVIVELAAVGLGAIVGGLIGVALVTRRLKREAAKQWPR